MSVKLQVSTSYEIALYTQCYEISRKSVESETIKGETGEKFIL